MASPSEGGRDMRLGRRNRTKRALAAAAVLVGMGSVAASLASSTVASASTLNGVATLTNPATNAALSSGGSKTVFTVVLPSQSDCSGDTASGGYHVFSYLLPQGTSVTSDSFSTGSPSEGLGLIDEDGYYGQANTAPTSGQVIDIPTDFEWADLLNIGETAPELDGGSSAVWEAGIACANSSGVVTDYWNTQVTFTANGSDPNGFVWTAVPGSVPPAPTSPSAAAGNASATVSWTDPASNGGSPVTGYDVYASTTNPPSTSGPPSATASGATATSAPVTGLTNAEYFFVVTAVNGDGQSAASSPVVNATPTTVPGAPTSPSLVRSGKNITVNWVDPATNGGLPITAYDVYESTTNPPSTSGTPKATANGPTATSVTIKKLSKTAKYYFVVLAVNADGKSAPSPVVTTQDKTTTKVNCTPATVNEGATTVCTATVSDSTLPSDTPAGTVTWSSSGSGTFTGGPACTLHAGTCSVNYVPSATGNQTVKAVFPTSSQWLTSNGSAKIKVKP
ncbi:MAG TPA: fibronectin type III domain-containing protein [Acidimicrobiales bacterium]|nr:fibronectin type III domain-containing protein [Acidimicrobiales bacterium]